MSSEQLRIIGRQLASSTKTSWHSGDLRDFRDWSGMMSNTITNSVTMLNNIADTMELLEIRVAQLEASNAEKDKTILALATKLS